MVLLEDERGIMDVEPVEGEAVKVVDVDPVEGEAVEVVRQIEEGDVEGGRGVNVEGEEAWHWNGKIFFKGKVCYINCVMCFI